MVQNKRCGMRLYSLLVRVYLKIKWWQFRGVLTLQRKVELCLLFYSYVESIRTFPGERISVCKEIANAVVSYLLEYKEVGIDPSDSRFEVLHRVLISDPWFKERLGNFYLTRSCAFSVIRFKGDPISEKSHAAISKARLYLGEVNFVDYKECLVRLSSIKTDLKAVKKCYRTAVAEKVEDEKQRIIGIIEVTASDFGLAISFFSLLLLVGGFLYNKFILGYFGYSVGDFFTASDYVSSSIDVLFIVLISCLLGMVSYFWGLSRGLSRSLHAEQFEIEVKGRSRDLALFILPCAVFCVWFAAVRGNAKNPFLFMLFLFLGLEIYRRLRFLKYFKNGVVIEAAFVAVFLFSLQLGFKIAAKVENLTAGGYSGPYGLGMSAEYARYSGLEFFMATSSYVFLWDNERRSTVVIPKSGVIRFESKVD
ncbi:hypothetical protein D3C84_481380 [compost metagenome]